jgi:hypothetical protein
VISPSTSFVFPRVTIFLAPVPSIFKVELAIAPYKNLINTTFPLLRVKSPVEVVAIKAELAYVLHVPYHTLPVLKLPNYSKASSTSSLSVFNSSLN